MKLVYDIDYIKTKGYWGIPFGREFTTLREIPRPGGGTIPAGYKWDGGTGVPHWPNAATAYGYLIHDYTYSQRDMSFHRSNWESVVELWKGKPSTAIFTAIAYVLLMPILLMYWYTDETKINKWWLYTVSVVMFTLNVWLLIWLYQYLS